MDITSTNNKKLNNRDGTNMHFPVVSVKCQPEYRRFVSCAAQQLFDELRLFAFLWQVKIRKKLKSTDKDNGLMSPTIPSITFDSVFDSGRELSSDVYSTVGTGTGRSQQEVLWCNGLQFTSHVWCGLNSRSNVHRKATMTSAPAADHTSSEDGEKKMFSVNLSCRVVATGGGGRQHKVQTLKMDEPTAAIKREVAFVSVNSSRALPDSQSSARHTVPPARWWRERRKEAI